MSHILELTDENYREFMETTKNVVFIDFYSDTCPPCQTLLSYLPRLSEHYKDANVVIAKVNAGYNPKLSQKFMLASVPLTVVIGENKMVKKAEVGLLTLDKYFKMIDKEVNLKKSFFQGLLGFLGLGGK